MAHPGSPDVRETRHGARHQGRGKNLEIKHFLKNPVPIIIGTGFFVADFEFQLQNPGLRKV
jgi:hypothetical protein